VHEHAIDSLPWIAKLSANIRESIYQFALFGMTQQTMVDMKAIGTMVIVGALSAFGGSFLTARDNAFELKQYARAQEEFRVEMRLYMRESTTEIRSLADRLTRQEILNSTFHAGQTSTSPSQPTAAGMNGGVRK
jgi:hypothetical protein